MAGLRVTAVSVGRCDRSHGESMMAVDFDGTCIRSLARSRLKLDDSRVEGGARLEVHAGYSCNLVDHKNATSWLDFGWDTLDVLHFGGRTVAVQRGGAATWMSPTRPGRGCDPVATPGHAALITHARSQGVRVVLAVHWNNSLGSDSLYDFFHDTAAMRASAASMCALAKQARCDGLSVDYEVGNVRFNSTFKELFADYLQLLSTFATKEKLTVTPTLFMDLPGNTGVDAAAIADASTDGVVLMTYDYHWGCSDRVAGPNTPFIGNNGSNVNATVSWSLQHHVPASEILLGIAWYGREFPTTSGDYQAHTNCSATDPTQKAGAYQAPLAMQRAHELGLGGVLWDETSRTPWYRFQDKKRPWLWWEGYFDDSRSLAFKYDLVKTSKLKGVLIWMLNGCTRTEAPEMWEALEQAFGKRKPPLQKRVGVKTDDSADDPRDILGGTTIADALPYYDQPQIVRHPSGTWVCVLTGASKEGDPEENVYVTRSSSSGQTWETPRPIEPFHSGGPPAAWVNPILTRSGRIYAYYTYDEQNHTHLPGSTKVRDRTDMLGSQVFRYSDDAGVTFSDQRFTIPIDSKAIDRRNEFNSSVHEGWAVGKPVSVGGVVHTQFAKRLCASPKDKTPRCGLADPRNPLSKLRQYTEMQAFVVSSDNIETEADPHKIRWSTMPQRAEGLQAKAGKLAEEGDVVPIGPGKDLYYFFRTYDGFLGAASYISGVWKDKQRASRLLDGTALKNPNGPIAPRRFVDSRDGSEFYLMLFYNRGLPGMSKSNTSSNSAWGSRNPYWLSAGWSDETNTTIQWSEPECVLYSHNASDRIGYPDLFFAEPWETQQGAGDSEETLYMTETNKQVARLHAIDKALVNGLVAQRTNSQLPKRADWVSNNRSKKQTLPFALPDLRLRQSISFELWLAAPMTAGTTLLLDCHAASGAAPNNSGISIHTSTHGNRTVVYSQFGDGLQVGKIPPSDGSPEPNTRCVVDSTRSSSGQHHIGLVIDGVAKLALITVDGVLCDGGDHLEATQGFWFGLNSTMGSLAGSGKEQVSCHIHQPSGRVRGYERALRVSELVGSWKYGNHTAVQQTTSSLELLDELLLVDLATAAVQ